MNDFRLDIKIKNNRLVSAIEKNYSSVAAFCKQHDLCQSTTNDLCNLKIKPTSMRRTGQDQNTLYWKKAALEVAVALGLLPEEIWPEHMQEMTLRSNVAHAYVSSEYISNMISKDYRCSPMTLIANTEQNEQIFAMLDTLTEVEKQIVIGSFGFDGTQKTFIQLGEELGLSSARVNQLKNKAIRKMQHPSRCEKFRDFLTADEDL